MSAVDIIVGALAKHRVSLRIRTTNPGSQQRFECTCGENGTWHFPNIDRSTGYGSGDRRPMNDGERHQADEINRAIVAVRA